MTIVFPAVTPSEHPTILAGRFPHVEKRSTGGRVRRIGLSNVQLDGEITLKYTNINTEQLLQLRTHWILARGTTLEFALPAQLFPSMSPTTRARLLATTWRHKEPPKVVDICGGQPDFLLHSLEFTLVAQPRRVASPVDPTAPTLSLPVVPITAPGAQLRVATAFAPGAAGIDEIKVPGAALVLSPVLLPGAASTPGTSTAPGAALAVSVEFTPGPTTTPSAALNLSTSFDAGKGSIGGVAPGAALTANVVLAAGGASVTLVQAPGAALAASVALAPGGASITGGTAPGATLALSTGLQPGAAQSIGPGAALAVSLVLVPGVVPGQTATGSNSTNIVIPAYESPATPYPSIIQISGKNGLVIGATVRLKSLSHSTPGVFTCYIESPSGSTTYLLSDPSSSSVTNLDLTFTSSSTALPPNPLTSGTYRPQAVASSVTHSIGFGSFVGDDPNGQWKLYAFNRNSLGTSSSISGGWEIEINLGSVYTSSNASSISIPDSGAATPYPSPITVSGATGTITTIEVTLNGLTHANASQLQFLLVGPTGVNTMILCNVGGNVSSRTLSFSNLDFKSVSSTLASGSYGLTSNSQQTLPSPAPGPAPYPSSFAGFLGTDPNGTWNLYIHDKTAGNSGSLSGGWTLRITTTTS